MRTLSLTIAAWLACTGPAIAQNRTTTRAQPAARPDTPVQPLKIGDPAPKLGVNTWIKGPRVNAFEEGEVYVVEFWATWCPPCRRMIPYLTELQKARPDLVVVAIAAREERPEKGQPDRRLPILKNFVEDQGDKMKYRVGFDSDGDTLKSWMEAGGRTGIPSVFVVDGDSKISFMGYPWDDGFHPAIDAALKAARAKKPAEPKKPADDKKAKPTQPPTAAQPTKPAPPEVKAPAKTPDPK